MWKKLLWILLPLAAMHPGCNCVNFLLYNLVPPMGNPDIEAETDALSGKTVAVAIYIPGQIAYEYPLARRRLAIRIADEIRKKVEVAGVVDPLRVIRYQDQDVNWDRLSRGELARKFNADSLLYVTLREYSLRERGSVSLFRGNIVAEAKLYDASKPDCDAKVWQLDDLRVTYPKDAKTGVHARNMNQVAQAVETLFVHKLVRRFYKHKAEADEKADLAEGGAK